MKFSIFKNDKSTVKDEIILLLIVLAFMAIGIIFIITTPSFWLIDKNDTLVFGVLMLITGVMFIPSLIYRFTTNDKPEK